MKEQLLQFIANVAGVATGLYIAKILGWLPKQVRVMFEFNFVSTYEMFFLFVVVAVCVGNLLAIAIYEFVNYMFGG